MEHTVTTKKWYVVTGTAGATVTSPDGKKTYCTVPEGGQGVFYATAPKVVTSDDSVEVVETTFNSAPVKMRLLGLLGGGVSTGLPSGYLAAEFLELGVNKAWQYVEIKQPFNAATGLHIKAKSNEGSGATKYAFAIGANIPGTSTFRGIRIETTETSLMLNMSDVGTSWRTYSIKHPAQEPYNDIFYNFKNDRRLSCNGIVHPSELKELLLENGGVNKFFFGAQLNWTGGSISEFYYKGRYFEIEASQEEEIILQLVPVLDKNGVPCMFDKVTRKPFYNSGTGSFIVGMDMEQARKLGKLPAGGGTLTVSLPSNYGEDEGVVNALATAQDNGWKITIQTYEAEAGAASTFALRRIWVRKTQNEQGSYVDTDGFRWQVEWCVDVVGSSPEAEGYEPFRSVDVAVNYWNLQPWVDPEHDEILTNTNEQ